MKTVKLYIYVQLQEKKQIVKYTLLEEGVAVKEISSAGTVDIQVDTIGYTAGEVIPITLLLGEELALEAEAIVDAKGMAVAKDIDLNQIYQNTVVQSTGDKKNEDQPANEQKPENEVLTGIYINEACKLLHEGKVKNEYWFIKQTDFEVIKKDAQKAAEQLLLKRSEKKAFIYKQLNESLANSSVKKTIKISSNEGRRVPPGKTTVKYVYEETNETNQEHSYSIIFNISTCTIEFGRLTIGKKGENKVYIYKQEGANPVIGNLHGHPDKKSNRADGQFHTTSGESEEDKIAASALQGAVYNVEGGKVYFYTPNQNTATPNPYKKTTDPKTLLEHAFKIRIYGEEKKEK